MPYLNLQTTLMRQRLTLPIPSEKDAQLAREFWADKEFKTWAVDVSAGPEKRLTFCHTYYARARTSEAAIACVQRNMVCKVARARYRGRLAGPYELGCVKTSSNN
jgi:hypothetical protein